MNILNKRLLVVEDTPEYELLIKAALGDSPYFKFAKNLKEARELLQTEKFELIILDIILPDGTGYDLLINLKSKTGQVEVPVIITSGKGELSDKVMGLSSGALDYIVKPFNPLEFRARIESKIKFFEQFKSTSSVMTIGNLQIDANTLHTYINAEFVDLSPLEFKLLKFFCDSNEQIFSRNQLLSSVWGQNTYVLDRTVDSTIASIRKKTKDWDYKIKSVYGMGYKLNKKAAA